MASGKGTPDPWNDPIASALIDLVAERSYESVSVGEVIERAGVTRTEFERRFADKEDCALKVYEAFIVDFSGQVKAAYDAEPSWRPGLRAAAYAAATWISDHPRTARFGAVDVLEAQSEMIRVRREEVFQYCAGLIDAGRAEAPDPAAIPDSSAVMAIGSIAEMLTQRMQSERNLEPVRLVPELMYLAVRPYVGEAVAREELSVPPRAEADRSGDQAAS
jgi:AcrR family transcriptional regulator